MDEMNLVLEKIAEIEASLSALRATLEKTTKPCRLAFVNFFPEGKSYAYTADDSIKEGDIVLVPTDSRGDIPGVVVYANDYAENDLPFHNTKTVIGKLENLEVTPANMVTMMTELSPAIAGAEASKSRLLAFLERRAAAQDAPTAQEETADADSSILPPPLDNEELEGDGACNHANLSEAEQEPTCSLSF